MDFVVSAFKVSLCVVFQFNLDVVQGDIPFVGTYYGFPMQLPGMMFSDLPWFSFTVLFGDPLWFSFVVSFSCSTCYRLSFCSTRVFLWRAAIGCPSAVLGCFFGVYVVCQGRMPQ